MSPKGVQQLALGFGTRERLMCVLAVQVEQFRTERRQLRKRCGPAVDPRATAALRILDAAQQHFRPGIELGVGKPALGAARGGDVEHRRELRTLRPWPQLTLLEAVAENEPERIEQDRLARTRLARQHGEAG